MGLTNAEALEFQILLTESFSSGLAPAVKSLDRFDKKLNDTQKSVGRFGSNLNFGGMDFGALERGGRFFTFDLAQGLGMVVGAIEKVISGFASLTKSIVKTAAEAQDLNLAIELNVGKDKASQVQALADQISATTRADDDTVKKAILPLLDIGVNDIDQLDNLVTAALDLAARRGQSSEAISESLASFQKLALKGEVDARALRQLGIGEASFFTNLADLLGTTQENAEKLAKAGKVASETLMSVALDELANREGGALGPGALRGAETLGGTLERLSNATGNMFKQIANGDGMKAIQAALSRIVDVMTGPAGTKFVNSIDKLLGRLGEVITPDRIEGFLTAISDGVTWVVDKLTNAQPGDISWLDKFVIGVQASVKVLGVLWDVISAVAGALGWLVDNFVGFFTWMSDLGNKITEATAEIGTNIWKGLVDGISGGIDAVKGAVSGLGDGAIASLKNLLGIASPSKVMADLGLNTAEGFAIGIQRGDSAVEEATRQTIVDTVMQPAKAGAGGRVLGGGGSFTFRFETTIAPAAGTDAEEIARTVAQQQRIEFVRLLDEIGLASGAAQPEAA